MLGSNCHEENERTRLLVPSALEKPAPSYTNFHNKSKNQDKDAKLTPDEEDRNSNEKDVEECAPLELKEDPPTSKCIYLGYFLAIMAGVCSTSNNVMVKFLPSVSLWELLVIRSLLQIFTMIPRIISTKSSLLGNPESTRQSKLSDQEKCSPWGYGGTTGPALCPLEW